VSIRSIRALLVDVESWSVGPVVLRDGEKWGPIQVIPKVEGSHQKLELRLYSGKGEARQRVHIFVNALDPG